MNTIVQLSLPQEQIQLIERVEQLVKKVVESQNKSFWLTEDEAAERVKVSKSTLQKWRKEGWLRHYRDGEKIVLYRADQLDADIEKRLFIRSVK